MTFTLTSEDLKLLDGDMHWVVVPGTIDIMIGRSSADIAVKGTLTVQAPAEQRNARHNNEHQTQKE